MLENRVTAELREVDVVIRSTIAGHQLVVSVEATATGRKADTSWVERMLGKHADLPTSHLVLVSQAGFSATAMALAAAKGAAMLSPEMLGRGDASFQIVNALPALWPKVLQFQPERARLEVCDPVRGNVWVAALPDNQLFLADDTAICTVNQACEAVFLGNFERTAEQIHLADMTSDREETMLMQVGPPWTVSVAGQVQQLYLRYEERSKPELHPIAVAQFIGRAHVTVTQIDLTHQKLGQATYAFGHGRIGHQRATIVISEGESGGVVTVHFGEPE